MRLLPPQEQQLIDGLWKVYFRHRIQHACDSVEVDTLDRTGNPLVAHVGPECFIAQTLLRFLCDFEYGLKARRR